MSKFPLRHRVASLAASVVIALAATLSAAGDASATVRNIADGRRVETGGDRCENWWWSNYRLFSSGPISIAGFRDQFYNRARIAARTQYSLDNGVTWREFFSYQTVEVSGQGVHGAMGVSGFGPVQVSPLATQRYVMRTVYRVSWARTDINGGVLSWTKPIVLGEDRSSTAIHYSAGGIRHIYGCVILSLQNR